MNNILQALKLPGIIGFLLTLPFNALELANRRYFNEGFPFPLFAILWVLATTLFYIFMPIARKIRAGAGILTSPSQLIFNIALLILLAWVWVGILMDQMPCFFGLQNCD